MKNMIYSLIVLLIVVSGLVLANHEIVEKPDKLHTATKQPTALEKWEATPDGINFKNWKASPAGQKVQASIGIIRKSVKDYSDMEAVVTSLSLPTGSRLGFGLMVKISNEDFILAFGSEKAERLQDLQRLNVNDKIIIRSHGVSFAPKYAYPIIAGDYVEQSGKVIYKKAPRQGGC